MRDTDSTTKLDSYVTYKFYEHYEAPSYSSEYSTYSPGPPLCYVVVTCKSFLWTVLTIISTLLVVASIISPHWLVGRPRWVGLRPQTMNGTIYDYREQTYRPTLGVFNRCTKLHRGGVHIDSCATYVTGLDMPSDQFPDTWKSALILFAMATTLLTGTVVTSFLSLCIRVVFHKSVFTLSGLVQAIAGLFMIVGLILYPLGWGSERVKNICGDYSGPFLIDDCQLGWSFYSCIGGTVLVFAASMLSIQADLATSSDKVETEALDGKTFIAVL